MAPAHRRRGHSTASRRRGGYCTPLAERQRSAQVCGVDGGRRVLPSSVPGQPSPSFGLPRLFSSESWHGLLGVEAVPHTPGNSSSADSDLNDLHAYDPAARQWTDLGVLAGGLAPKPRMGHGFAAAAGQLFIFGGCQSGSLRLNQRDARALACDLHHVRPKLLC
jgi:hypothetical protein